MNSEEFQKILVKAEKDLCDQYDIESIKNFNSSDLGFEQETSKEEELFWYVTEILETKSDSEIYFIVKEFIKKYPIKKNNYWDSIAFGKKSYIILKILLENRHSINTKSRTDNYSILEYFLYYDSYKCAEIAIKYGGLLYTNKKRLWNVSTIFNKKLLFLGSNRKTIQRIRKLVETHTVYNLKIIIIRKIYDNQIPIPKNYPKLLLQIN